MGMTYEQYWEESPYLAVAYRNAYKLKRKAFNEEAWLQGFYIYYAFAAVMADVFAKRGAKKHEYLEKPVDIFPLTEAEKKRREQMEYEKMQKAMEEMRRQQQRKKKQKGE